jgi:hypothetical protein
MGKASRTKTDIHRRERIAAQRVADRKREQRNRLLIAGGAILAVIVIVVGFVVFQTSRGNSSNTAGGASNGPTGAALASVVKDVTTVPASTLDQVGAGGSSLGGGIKGISGGTPLTANGKPQVFYDGAEYCPFCAAARWGMVVSLSRFGTFSGLKTVHSSTTDSPPNVPTWTFYGSTYTSKYITFSPVEETTNVPVSGGQGYTSLQTPTQDQQAILKKYNAPPYVPANQAGSIPFIDFGGKYLQVGDLSMLGPTNLTGDWTKIAGDLKNPSSSNAKSVLAAANFTTAAICKLTNNQPTTACTPTVQALESQLNG